MDSAPKREHYRDIREFIRDWDNYWDNVKPSRSAMLRRPAMVANDAAAAIDLQIGRIRDGLHSRDPDAVWTAFIDVEFLISSLWKMRLAAKLTRSVMGQSWAGLRDFRRGRSRLEVDARRHGAHR
jgi:hypothetical protein